MKHTKPFRSVKQVAAHWGVSPYTFYEKIRLGEIPHYKFGRKILLDPDEVKAVLRFRPNGRKGPDVA